MRAKNATNSFKIIEAASLLGISSRTLRFYEEVGLIRPQRGPKGARFYGRDDLVRMQLILRLKMGGFKLLEIRDLVVLDQEEEDLPAMLSRVGEIQEEINRRMACMRGLKEELVAYRLKIQAVLAE